MSKSNVVHFGRVVRRDPSRALSRRVVYGSVHSAGTYEEILHGHPGAYNGMLQVRMTFANSEPRVIEVDEETPEEYIFRRRCESVIDTMIFDDNPNTGLPSIMEHLSSAITMGASVFELRWGDVLSLCPIPLYTITSWERAGVYLVPKQGRVQIPPERLVGVTPVDLAGPEGIGVLRPIVFLFELWKQTLQDMGVRAGKEAGGIIGTQSEMTGEDAAEQTQIALDQFAYGEIASILMPHGYTATQAQLPPASNNLQLIEYCDQQIRQLVDETVTSLVTSDTGNRALGETLSDGDDASRRGKLEYCTRKFGEQLFGALALQWGFEGRVPRLTIIEDADDPQARLRSMRDSVDITGWFDSDRDEARRLAGLEPIESAGGEIDINPQPALLARDEFDVPDVVDVKDLIRGRVDDELRLSARVSSIAQSYRPRIIAAANDEEALKSLESSFLAEVEVVVRDYADIRREKAFRWGERYIERYERMIDVEDLNPSDPVFDAAKFEAAATERVRAQTERSAKTIWNRVSGEALEQVAARTENEQVPPTRITPKGLAAAAASVGHIAEQAGRLSGVASQGARTGFAVVGAWRVSFEDSKRCDVCTARTGVFHPAGNLPQLPDPDCEGGAERCRCGLMPVIRRV